MKDNIERSERKKKYKLIEIRILCTIKKQNSEEYIEREKIKFLKRSRRVKRYIRMVLNKIEECLPNETASRVKIIEATKQNTDYLIVVGPNFEFIFETKKHDQTM